MRSRPTIAAAILGLALGGCHTSTQQADLSFEPAIPQPAYPEERGPVVQIDEAHFNFHTVDGRYAPFAKQLRRDGYVVQGLAVPTTPDELAKADIYVIGKDGRTLMGMNRPDATQNPQFPLNVMHWLSGSIE